jgi:purine-binding chemotaxis protein CheW
MLSHVSSASLLFDGRGGLPEADHRLTSDGPKNLTLLVFRLDEQRYALRLSNVVRVLPMMEVTPLPGAPAAVVGAIDVAGRVIAVLDLRCRFGLPAREPLLSDVLIVVCTDRSRWFALPADSVVGLVERPDDEVIPTASIALGLRHIDGVVKVDQGMAWIHDADTFLSSSEQNQLRHALDGARESA